MITLNQEFKLKIAGSTFCFTSMEPGIPLVVEQLYEFYLNSDLAPGNLALNIHLGISEELYNENPVFEAEYHYGLDEKTPYFWSIHKKDEVTIIVCRFEKDETPYFSCCFTPGNTVWDIYVAEPRLIFGKPYLEPLPYPAGPLIMYYFFSLQGYILLHCSGIHDPLSKKGFIFSGVSGVGKTTISRIWTENGAQIINDDRLILKNTAKGLFMYNNPLYMKDVPREAQVSAIFLLRQSKNNELIQLKGVNALSRLMAFCIQHHYDKKLIELMTGMLSVVISQVPVYELGFAPDERVVSFVRNQF